MNHVINSILENASTRPSIGRTTLRYCMTFYGEHWSTHSRRTRMMLRKPRTLAAA